MLFKSFQELGKHFVFRSLARFYIWMLLGIVGALNIIDIDFSIARSIEDLESLDCELCAEVIHWANDHTDEFIKVNLSVSIDIEASEERGEILRLHLDSEVLDRFIKLVWVQSSAAIVVHNLELAT